MKPSERIDQLAQETHRSMCERVGKNPLSEFISDIVYVNAIATFLDEQAEKEPYPLLTTQN